MEPKYLSTGEVARLCGVTRDAVVKWIKKGKLEAAQTPGGHYRVPEAACETLIQETDPSIPPVPGQLPARKSVTESLRCWEYFGERGSPREACRNCLVYLARAQKCYRLAELGESAGHRLHFCRNDCRTCAYYRACQGMATEVLMVTRDEALTHRLLMKVDPGAVSMRFARSGYESSSVVSSFSPALIILDSSLPEVRNGQLQTSMVDDTRIPGARIVVALREGDSPPRPQGVATLKAPFTAADIERLAEGAVASPARSPRGGA